MPDDHKVTLDGKNYFVTFKIGSYGSAPDLGPIGPGGADSGDPVEIEIERVYTVEADSGAEIEINLNGSESDVRLVERIEERLIEEVGSGELDDDPCDYLD